MAVPQSVERRWHIHRSSGHVSKYGLVPKDVMPETNSSENTARMASLIALKLREQGLQLRDMASKKAKPAAIENAKVEMLSTIYVCLS